MYRAFWLASSRDLWVGSSLRDGTGQSGKSLGQNFDLRVRWNANRYLALESGYAHFIKGSYLNRVPGGTGREGSDYFFLATDIKAKLLPF